MKEYYKIPREVIEKSVKEIMSTYYNEKEPDINVIADGDYFAVTIRGSSRTINTGIGGLKLFLEGGLPSLYKVRYNGIILTEEERDKFFTQLKNYKHGE